MLLCREISDTHCGEPPRGQGEALKLLNGETIVTERNTISQTSFYYFVLHIEPQIIKTSPALNKGTTSPPPWVGSDRGTGEVQAASLPGK